MEYGQLQELAKTVSAWPGSEAELSSSARSIVRLLGTPFAALLSTPSEGARSETLGFGTAGEESCVSTAEAGGADLLREFLRRQLAPNGSDSDEPRTVRLTPDAGSIPQLKGISQLLFARLGQGSARDSGVSGWLVVGYGSGYGSGSANVPSALQQLGLAAVVMHFNHLAEIHRLEKIIGTRNQFLSIASHELKTPLTSIYGMLQLEERMIRLKKDDDSFLRRDKLQSYFKMVIRQVERLNELIDALLDVSRIQSGRFMVEPTDTDVASVLREVTSSRLAVIAEEAGLRINVEAPECLVAWVDSVRFEEVVTNIVMNAIRFSPEGGAVWIKLRDEGGSFRLVIRDQGPSIPPEDRERIFRPFERAQRTARMGGLGLGLYISRQIAQLHGGNVSLAESIPGKGNVFEATFPVRNLSLVSA